MAEEKSGFLLYADQRTIFDKLPDEVAGRLIKHIYSYVNDENPQIDDLLIEIAFEPIKLQLKRDLTKWEEKKGCRSEAGKKGAEARWQTMANDGKRISPMAKMAVTVTDNVTVTVTDKERVKRFAPPTQTDVYDFMIEKLDEFTAMAEASKFFDYYSANGWKVGKNPMKDWKSAVRNWIRNMQTFKNNSNGQSKGTSEARTERAKTW